MSFAPNMIDNRGRRTERAICRLSLSDQCLAARSKAHRARSWRSPNIKPARSFDSPKTGKLGSGFCVWETIVPVMVDPQIASEKSRLVLSSFTSLSMRLMENWRQVICDVTGELPDYEKTMIIGAIITIGAEKLIRGELEPNLQTLSAPLPADRLTKCNVASVAAAVRLNSETVRRKINELIDKGLVVKDPHGSLQITPELLEVPEVIHALQAQLELLRRTADQLKRIEVLRTPQG